jgi:hypothetical protein
MPQRQQLSWINPPSQVKDLSQWQILQHLMGLCDWLHQKLTMNLHAFYMLLYARQMSKAQQEEVARLRGELSAVRAEQERRAARFRDLAREAFGPSSS